MVDLEAVTLLLHCTKLNGVDIQMVTPLLHCTKLNRVDLEMVTYRPLAASYLSAPSSQLPIGPQQTVTYRP